MADNVELEIINHLLEVEKNASILIDDAKIEADRRTSEAKAEYNQEYKEKFDVLAAEKDKAYHEKMQQITEKHAAAMEEFKKSYENLPQNKENLKALLEKLLFQNA